MCRPERGIKTSFGAQLSYPVAFYSDQGIDPARRPLERRTVTGWATRKIAAIVASRSTLRRWSSDPGATSESWWPIGTRVSATGSTRREGGRKRYTGDTCSQRVDRRLHAAASSPATTSRRSGYRIRSPNAPSEPRHASEPRSNAVERAGTERKEAPMSSNVPLGAVVVGTNFGDGRSSLHASVTFI